VLLSWFYLVLVLVSQEGETRGVRILRVFEQNERCEDFFFTINQFLQLLSCQSKTTHYPLPM
jgi:hypothetical protein